MSKISTTQSGSGLPIDAISGVSADNVQDALLQLKTQTDTKADNATTQAALNLKYDASNPSGYQTVAQVTSTVSAASTADRDRANHTGTQLASTISDLAESVQDIIGATLVDTASVDFTYNDVANTITAAVLPAGVDHNSLQNFVANKHIDHSTVSIAAGTGLSGGGDITATRTLNIANTTVSAGSYGNTTNVPTFTVNAQGQITAATNTAITFPVTSIFGRTGAVTAQTNDYTFAQINKTTSSLADLTTRSASDLSSGTLLDARLSSNVPLKDTVNVFTGSIEISSTTQGFLQPRMTTAQRIAIPTPAEGLQVYDTDLSAVCRYSGAGWFYDFAMANSTIQSTTSSTYTNLTGFVTPVLHPGNYILEFEGTYQSTATTTGVGFRLAQGTATISFVSINWRFSQAWDGSDKYYEYSQTALADNVTSTATLTTNTNYPVTGLGIFSVSVGGTVALQFRSEVNASGVSIRPTSILSIRKV